MKILIIVLFSILTTLTQSRGEPESIEATSSSPFKVIHDFGTNFKIITKTEIILFWKNEDGGTTSWRSSVVDDHGYAAQLLDNGFIQIKNKAGIIYIPLENIASISVNKK